MTGRARALLLGGVLLLSFALCALALIQGWVTRDSIEDLVRRSGSWGMGAYVVGVVLMELLWLPRAWGLLAGGALFGPLAGAGLSMVGDLLGAAICFALARGLAGDWVAGVLDGRPRAKDVADLLARRHGGITVAMLRICPVAHYTLCSYAAGVAGVRPLPFMVGTAVGIIPAALLYPLMGHAAMSPGSPLFWTVLGLVAVFFLATLLASKRLLRK